MLQLHQSAGAAQRRDAVRLRHQRLQPHLPQLQGETPQRCGHLSYSGKRLHAHVRVRVQTEASRTCVTAVRLRDFHPSGTVGSCCEVIRMDGWQTCSRGISVHGCPVHGEDGAREKGFSRVIPHPRRVPRPKVNRGGETDARGPHGHVGTRPCTVHCCRPLVWREGESFCVAFFPVGTSKQKNRFHLFSLAVLLPSIFLFSRRPWKCT